MKGDRYKVLTLVTENTVWSHASHATVAVLNFKILLLFCIIYNIYYISIIKSNIYAVVFTTTIIVTNIAYSINYHIVKKKQLY